MMIPENYLYHLPSTNPIYILSWKVIARYLSYALLCACYRVIDHESKNKMGPSNLIRLFGPTLMTVDGDPVSVPHRYNYGKN